MSIYIDRVFVLNLCVDYLLLLSTARLSGMPLRRIRFLLCGTGGALYATAAFFPGCAWLTNPICKLLSGALLSYISFRREAYVWRMMGLFFLLSGALAGVILAVGFCIGAPELLVGKIYRAEINWELLLGGTVALSLFLNFLFRQGARHGGGETVTIEVSINGVKGQIRALHDTGNTLRNPIDGQPVLVVEQSALMTMLRKADAEILRRRISPEESIAQLYASKSPLHTLLLPFHSVGKETGLLLAIRSDYIKLNHCKYPHILLALSRGTVSDGGGYCALWNGFERGKEDADPTDPAADLPANMQTG